MKRSFCIFMITVFVLSGCAAPRLRSDRGLLASLRKVNDERRQENKELEKQIKMLKKSKEIDIPKAQLLEKLEAVEKQNNDVISALYDRNQKIRQLEKGNDRLELEVIDARNESIVLKQRNDDLNSLVTKLTERIKLVEQKRSIITDMIISRRKSGEILKDVDLKPILDPEPEFEDTAITEILEEYSKDLTKTKVAEPSPEPSITADVEEDEAVKKEDETLSKQEVLTKTEEPEEAKEEGQFFEPGLESEEAPQAEVITEETIVTAQAETEEPAVSVEEVEPAKEEEAPVSTEETKTLPEELETSIEESVLSETAAKPEEAPPTEVLTEETIISAKAETEEPAVLVEEEPAKEEEAPVPTEETKTLPEELETSIEESLLSETAAKPEEAPPTEVLTEETIISAKAETEEPAVLVEEEPAKEEEAPVSTEETKTLPEELETSIEESLLSETSAKEEAPPTEILTEETIISAQAETEEPAVLVEEAEPAKGEEAPVSTEETKTLPEELETSIEESLLSETGTESQEALLTEVIKEKVDTPDEGEVIPPSQEQADAIAKIIADSDAQITEKEKEEIKEPQKIETEVKDVEAKETVQALSPEGDIVLELINRWKEAREKRDIQEYFGFYSPNFKGGGMDFYSWYNHIYETFQSQKNVAIKITDIETKIENDGDRVVNFIQHLSAENVSDVGARTLRWRMEGDSWRIVEESWEPGTEKLVQTTEQIPPSEKEPQEPPLLETTEEEPKTPISVVEDKLPQEEPSKPVAEIAEKETPEVIVKTEKPTPPEVEKVQKTQIPSKAVEVDKVSTDEEVVENLLNKWKIAWENREIKEYFSFYSSKRFRGRGSMNFASWKKRKSKTLQSIANIDVKIADLQIKHLKRANVLVKFVQYYRADKSSDVGAKILHWKKESGGWKIVREKWKPAKEKKYLAELGEFVKDVERRIASEPKSPPIEKEKAKKAPSPLPVPPVVAAPPKAVVQKPEPAAPAKEIDQVVAGEKAVKELVTHWKAAWEKKDLNTFTGFYSSKFRGRGNMNLVSFNKSKARTFKKKKNINVRIDTIKTQTRKNGNIVINFLQYYRADKSSDVGVKTLHWKKENGSWKIIRESWKPAKEKKYLAELGKFVKDIEKRIAPEPKSPPIEKKKAKKAPSPPPVPPVVAAPPKAVVQKPEPAAPAKKTEQVVAGEKAVKELVTHWKAAWEEKDLDTFTGFYSSKFRGRGNMNLVSFNKSKARTFKKKKNINVRLDTIKTQTRKNGNIVIKFLQYYRADKSSDVGVKTLHWEKENGSWKIIRESWKPAKEKNYIAELGKFVKDVEKRIASEPKSPPIAAPSLKKKTEKAPSPPTLAVPPKEVAQKAKPAVPAQKTNKAASGEKAVKELVTHWKVAWEKKDLDTFIGFYSSKFRGRKNMNLVSFNKSKAKSFKSKENISVKISDIKTQRRKNGDIVVKFLQNYKAGKYGDIGIKTLRWQMERGGWKIIRESWKPKT